MSSAPLHISRVVAPPSQRCALDLCTQWPAVEAEHTNALVMDLFNERREITSLAVIENERPIGLINRDIFLSQMSKPYHREVYDRKSCIAFMDKEPLVVDASLSIEELTRRTVEVGEKALADGFIVTREGRFVGLGLGVHLMRIVSDLQAEKNRQIMHSIEYASVIQRAMLRSSREALAVMEQDATLVWQPRDVVGGDFYHFAQYEDGWFGAIADCTGHGVPGAFMTMIASSSLTQALQQRGPRDPSALLAAVNLSVKAMLGQSGDLSESNDGLDIACFWVDRREHTLTYAGARMALYVLPPDEATAVTLAPLRIGLGYADSPTDQRWPATTLSLQPGSLLFATTDGLVDQIGGPRRTSFGKRRVLTRLAESRHLPTAELCQQLSADLATWQQAELRRDDLTFFCIKVGSLTC
ncbi:protein serine/threonine phosphatase [Pseudomonas oryzihabitans]|nr:protein-serine/threonine phosphatase [Pseudomonas psychrotolerans]KTS76754.1 protein serine/threonine phosphatase [Pseudomonas psychrotolerans]KTT00076.1 protein serine/threonine phosphatase [Pseudomonas psychrotolerans]KTT25020.1 protein serine/threonine phosphatase [Pseudomonas psychrotolerans]KTT40617.1 protein serine/threonine phosphatase [Pseudomonas psychrotolerans]